MGEKKKKLKKEKKKTQPTVTKEVKCKDEEKKKKKKKKEKKKKKDKVKQEGKSSTTSVNESSSPLPKSTTKAESLNVNNPINTADVSNGKKKRKRKPKNKKKKPVKFSTTLVKINRMKTVSVNGMPHGTKINNVRKFFRPCGGIQYITMQKFDDTGKTRGMCTITFKSIAATQKAIGLTGKWWGKRYVEIKPYIGLGDAYTPPNIQDMPEDCYTIYVGNLDFKVEEKDINGAFIGCGEIQEIRIAQDPDGNKRGFAHVTFVNQESVKKAILNLANGDYLLRNRPIKIDFDIPHVDNYDD